MFNTTLVDRCRTAPVYYTRYEALNTRGIPASKFDRIKKQALTTIRERNANDTLILRVVPSGGGAVREEKYHEDLIAEMLEIVKAKKQTTARKKTRTTMQNKDNVIPMRPATENKAPAAIVQVGGFSLDTQRQLIRDLELGERLGYARPAKFRELVKRTFAKNMNDIHQIPTVGIRVDGAPSKPATEYWLTRAQALKVTLRSETEAADRIADEVIAVFEAYQDGTLQPKPGLMRAPTGGDIIDALASQAEQQVQMVRALQQYNADATAAKTLATSALDRVDAVATRLDALEQRDISSVVASEVADCVDSVSTELERRIVQHLHSITRAPAPTPAPKPVTAPKPEPSAIAQRDVHALAKSEFLLARDYRRELGCAYDEDVNRKLGVRASKVCRREGLAPRKEFRQDSNGEMHYYNLWPVAALAVAHKELADEGQL